MKSKVSAQQRKQADKCADERPACSYCEMVSYCDCCGCSDAVVCC